MQALDDLADWATSLDASEVGADVRWPARRVLCDQITVSVAGWRKHRDQPWLQKMTSTPGTAQARLWHDARPAFAPYAALANRAAGDDLELTAGPECGAAGVAAAELAGATLGDLLVSIAVAAEVESYFRGWIQLGTEKHGLHPPAVFGAIAAAAVSGRLLGLRAKSFADALTTAAALAPMSPYVSFSQGATGKWMYGAWSQMQGLLAALWSRDHRMPGSPSIFDGAQGLAQALDHDALSAPGFRDETERRQNGWAIQAVTFKAYPCSRACHPALTALETLIDAKDIDDRDVAAIEVSSYPFSVELARRVLGDDPISAQMSIPHALALRLVFGELSPPDAFTAEKLSDERVRSLVKRLTLDTDDSGNELPRARRARVRLVLNNGDVVEETSGPKWSAESPATDDALRARAAALAGDVKSPAPWEQPDETPVSSLFGESAHV